MSSAPTLLLLAMRSLLGLAVGSTLVIGMHLRAAEAHASVMIVIDGLRPDYITPDRMPHLLALSERGAVAEAHHSVFPTVTRVNSASISTGTTSRGHGLMHNTIYIPAASAGAIDTGEAPALLAAEQALDGNLLTAVTLGEILTAAGKKVLVTGSGTTGSALLLNHKPSSASVLLTSRDFVRPAALQTRVVTLLGPTPVNGYPNTAGTRWAVDAFLEFGLQEFRPAVTLMWLTDPDGTAHRNGPGAPLTDAALKGVDAEVGRIVATLTERGLRDRVNIFVTADHGFSTHGGPFNLSTLLTARGLASGVKVVGGGQIYVQSGSEEKIRAIVRVLQETPWVGAVFTRARAAGGVEGIAAGTLSFDTIHYQHERAADILVDANWSHEVNAHGFAGRTTAGGVAGHGSASPYDIRIRLIAAGPDIKPGLKSAVPTGNIDLAPTLLHLHGLKVPASMTGRVLHELLRKGPSPASVRVERATRHARTDTAAGRYEVTLHVARVGATEYIDYAETKR